MSLTFSLLSGAQHLMCAFLLQVKDLHKRFPRHFVRATIIALQVKYGRDKEVFLPVQAFLGNFNEIQQIAY